MPRTYCYIDGESHYIRSEKAWQKIHNTHDTLVTAQPKDDGQQEFVTCLPDAKVFWNSGNVTAHMQFDHLFIGPPDRIIYFTSCIGDEDKLHSVRVMLRMAGLEPHVIREDRQLAAQRDNVLNSTGIIEKAKGVDIGMAVRMLVDAHNNNFDHCILYTSDVDYLPVIEALRRLGKFVVVCGYMNGLGKNSPLLHVPDIFRDNEIYLKQRLRYVPESE